MDRLKVSTVTPADYQAARNKRIRGGSKKQPSEPFNDDDDLTQGKIDRLPVAALANEWLRTVPGTDASREALSRLMECTIPRPA